MGKNPALCSQLSWVELCGEYMILLSHFTQLLKTLKFHGFSHGKSPDNTKAGCLLQQKDEKVLP